MVDHHEPADLHAQQLAAELRSDRAARAGHQYRATAHVGAHGGGVELNGLAPEDVLHLHGAQLGDEVVVAVDEVVHVRQRLDGHSGRAAGRDHRGAFAAAGRRHGDVHLVGLARLEDLGQIVRRPDHLDALEAVAQLVGVVVDERDRRVARQPVAEHLAQDQVAGVTGADDQHLLALSDERAPPRALDQRAGENARAAQQDQREDQVQHQRALRGRALARRAGEKALGDRVLLELRHAMRHRRVAVDGLQLLLLALRRLGVNDHAARELHDREPDQEHDRGDADRPQEGHDVRQRGVSPPLVVRPERGQADELDRDHDQDGLLPVGVPAGVALDLEADLVGGVPGDPHQDSVDGDLPQAVAVQYAHGPEVYAVAGTRAETACTTSLWAASPSVGDIGRARHSRAHFSVIGREPSG